MDRTRNTVAVAAIAGFVLAGHQGQAQTPAEPLNTPCSIGAEAIFAQRGHSVVRVTSLGVDPFRVSGRVIPSTGSGIVLDPLLVLTNYHVVRSAQMIAVDNGDAFSDAWFIGGDPALDIALLEVFPPLPVNQPLEFADPDGIAVGQTVYTLGYPLGIGKSLASGIISGVDRLIPLNTISWTTRYIQTDAAVSPGNSGGALLDDCGRIVGMVTLQSGHPDAENLGYVLPAATFLELLDEIETTGKVARPWHGIYGQMMNPLIRHLMTIATEVPPEGFLVETVEPGSAADEAGLRGGVFPVLWGMQEILLGGDVITSVNGSPVETLDDALRAVGSLQIGQTVDLTVWREGTTFETTAELGERPFMERDLWLGRDR